MTDHVRPPMHPHFMSMFESHTASARNRNAVPEHPNPESLIPSDLFDSLPEQSPSRPSSTYNTPPSVTNDAYAMSSTPGPNTLPYPGSTQPHPQSLSRLLALSQQQQWVYCLPEQAKIWKPRRNEIEDLENELKKHRLSNSSNAANGEEVDKESADSGQKQCQREGKEEEEGEVDDAKVDDGKEEDQQQHYHPRNLGPYPQPSRQTAGPSLKAPSPPSHTTTTTHNPSPLQSQSKEDEQHHHHPTLNLGPYLQPSRQIPYTTAPDPSTLPLHSSEFQRLLHLAQRNEQHPSPLSSPIGSPLPTPSPSLTPIPLLFPPLPHPNTSDANNPAAIEYLEKRLLQVQQERDFEQIRRDGKERERERVGRAEVQRQRVERKPYCWPPCEAGTEE